MACVVTVTGSLLLQVFVDHTQISPPVSCLSSLYLSLSNKRLKKICDKLFGLYCEFKKDTEL